MSRRRPWYGCRAPLESHDDLTETQRNDPALELFALTDLNSLPMWAGRLASLEGGRHGYRTTYSDRRFSSIAHGRGAHRVPRHRRVLPDHRAQRPSIRRTAVCAPAAVSTDASLHAW